MFSKELENLIQATLEDGILEDYEKAALAKRAQAEGVDLTELEIYINSILQKRKRELENQKNAEYAALEKQKKQEFGKVCPACGKQVPSLALVCECGYEFKKDHHESSVKLLSEKINMLKAEHGNKTYRGIEDSLEKLNDNKKLNKTIIETITLFPVPNTKEDIMEFLALAAPNSHRKGGIWGSLTGRLKLLAGLAVIIVIFGLFFAKLESAASSAFLIFFFGSIACYFFDSDTILSNEIADAWRAKFEQVLMKGRSLRADAEFTQMLDYYENQVANKTDGGNILNSIFNK